MQHGPAVRRRKLGEELRSLRHTSGLTSRDAAQLLGWHQSKVSRIETGTSGVRPADVSRLLDAYGLDDPQLRTLLETLAGSAGGGGTGWWHAYAVSSHPSTGTSSVWSPRPEPPARWRPRWCRGSCRPPTTRVR